MIVYLGPLVKKKKNNSHNSYVSVALLTLVEVSLSIFTSCAELQTTSENSRRYYTTKRLIRDLLSNTPNCYVRAGEFRGHLFTGIA